MMTRVDQSIVGKRLCYKQMELRVTKVEDGRVTLVECRDIGERHMALIVSVPETEMIFTEEEFDNLMIYQQWIEEFQGEY